MTNDNELMEKAGQIVVQWQKETGWRDGTFYIKEAIAQALREHGDRMLEEAASILRRQGDDPYYVSTEMLIERILALKSDAGREE